jgi:hypothetical protein
VVIGSYATGHGMMWDKSSATLKIKGNIEAGDISANRITSDTLNLNRIPTITASKISVDNLSSIKADLGSITAGSISGATITGGTLQTSSSGSRVVISSSGLKVYNSSGTNIGAFDWGGAWLASNQVFNFAGTGNELGQIYYSTDVTGMTVKSSYQVNLLGGTNGVYIDKLMGDVTVSSGTIRFSPRSSHASGTSTSDWAFYPYSSSGTYEYVVKIRGSNFWLDRRAV